MGLKNYVQREGKYSIVYEISRGINVRKDHTGNWTLFIDRNNKRKSKSFGPTDEDFNRCMEAGLKFDQKVKEATQNNRISKNNGKIPTFIEFVNQYVKDKKNCWVKETVERYKALIRLHLDTNELFHKPINTITRDELIKALMALKEKRSSATVETAHGLISGAFERALVPGHCQYNPAAKILKEVLPPKCARDEKPPDPFNWRDKNLFMKYVEKNYPLKIQLILKLQTDAGLRLGEALAFRDEFFDPVNKTYEVRKQIKRDDKFEMPKHGSVRVVDLPDSLVITLCELIEHIRVQYQKEGKKRRVDLLFIDDDSPTGLTFRHGKILRIIKKVCKEIGLRERCCKDLRHTYASMLLSRGESPKYVQIQLGHKDFQTTMNTYGHWIKHKGTKNLDDCLY